jgi:XTP/dITP diphosphohydrolase
MDLLVATGNTGKLREFREMLGCDRLNWASLADFPGIDEVAETGHTFRANAMLKASGYAMATGCWAMADDSGLEVDALDGQPGIYSARWASMHSGGQGDSANNALLLEQLKNVPDLRRSARFVCVLAVSDPAGRIVLSTRDVMEGRILREPVGGNGFGYDPIFQVADLACSSAQLPPQQKHQISHRGKALRRLNGLLGMISN